MGSPNDPLCITISIPIDIFAKEVQPVLKAGYPDIKPIKVKGMKPKQLDYLEAIDSFGGIAKAARAIGVSQPTISGAIANLESELNVQLINRDGSPVCASDYGRLLLRYRKISNRLIENAFAEIEEEKTANETVRFASRTPLGGYFEMVSRFQSLHPSITVLHTTPSEHDGQREFDVEFFASSNKQDKRQTLYLCDEHYVVLVSKRHPLANRDFVELGNLKKERFITSSSPSEMNSVVQDMFDEAGFSPESAIALPVFQDIMAMVEEGFGCCIGTDITWLYNTNLEIKPLRIIDTPRSRSLYLGFPPDAYISRASKLFANFLFGEISKIRQLYDEQFLY